VFRFLWQYAMPVSVFAYCYGRIFHVVRRQSKVVAEHTGRSQDVPMATTSRGQTNGQHQQQANGATTGASLSRTELNVLKTMIAVIICFIVCWSVFSVANLLVTLKVSIEIGGSLIATTATKVLKRSYYSRARVLSK